MTVAEELRARREALGLTQTDLAALLGISTQTVKAWEEGNRSPSQAALSLDAALTPAIAEALGALQGRVALAAAQLRVRALSEGS